MTLSAPTGGAALGLVTHSSIVITLNEIISQPTISLTSPPDNLTVFAGASLPLAANVNDPSGILSQVQFQINGAQVGSTGAAGPYVANVTAPTTPGTYQVTAIAIDNQNRQNSSTHTLVVAPADTTGTAPAAAIVTDVDGRVLAAGSSVTIAALASAGIANDQLASVTLYADGVAFAAFDGAGNPLASAYPPGSGPLRRDAGDPAAGNSVFKGTLLLPGLNKLVNLIAVAVNKAGQAQISKAATIQVVANAADKPPQVSLAGLNNGDKVKVNATAPVQVIVNDPDAGSASFQPANPRLPDRRAFNVSSVIAKVEYYLNQAKLATATQPPFAFDFAPKAAGTFVLTAIATDGAGLATVSEPLTVQAVADASTVSVAPSGKGVAIEGGGAGKVVFTRTGDTSADLSVAYKTKGGAKNGVDFKTLSGTVVIRAGQTTAKLKIKPVNDRTPHGQRKITLKLLPSPNGDYELGTPAQVKLPLIDND